MASLKRRDFLKHTLVGSALGLVTVKSHALSLTPTEVEGPFYPITPQKDKDADMTRVAGRDGVAKGTIIEIEGQVLDQYNKPVEDATIDLWQANSEGKYHHPHDSNPAPIDENFQAWAIIQSGAKGKFKLKTIMPGKYGFGNGSYRTPHIHLKVSKLGFESLLTQLYFPDEPLNQEDGLYMRKSKEEQAMMTAKKVVGTNRFVYNIVIERI